MMFLSMHLKEQPFEKIKAGTKTIEMRLCDNKRRFLTLGDTIEFVKVGSEEKLLCEVIGVHIYPTFKELYENFSKEELGYAKDEPASPDDMTQYYPLSEQQKYCVMGIEIKIKDEH